MLGPSPTLPLPCVTQARTASEGRVPEEEPDPPGETRISADTGVRLGQAQRPFKTNAVRGAPGGLRWLSVRLLPSAQVMFSRFVGSSPEWDSALTVVSLLGILSLSPSLSAPPPLVRVKAVSLSLSKYIRKLKKAEIR